MDIGAVGQMESVGELHGQRIPQMRPWRKLRGASVELGFHPAPACIPDPLGKAR
jgi:hypothetical protein